MWAPFGGGRGFLYREKTGNVENANQGFDDRALLSLTSSELTQSCNNCHVTSQIHVIYCSFFSFFIYFRLPQFNFLQSAFRQPLETNRNFCIESEHDSLSVSPNKFLESSALVPSSSLTSCLLLM